MTTKTITIPDGTTGGQYVHTTSLEGDKVLIETIHELGPDANPSYVGASRKIELSTNEVLITGYNDTGLPYERRIDIGYWGELSFPRSAESGAITIEQNPATLLSASEVTEGTIYGESFERPGYEVGITGEVSAFGLVKGPILDNQVIFTLPSYLAPRYTRIFTGAISDTETVRLDVLNSGQVVARTNGATVNYVSLENIRFRPNPVA